MRILICSFTFSPQANGVAEVVREQATGLAARGHEVVVATEFDPRRATSEAVPGVAVREFKVKTDPRSKAGVSGEVTIYQDYVAKAEVDIIMCHCWNAWPTDLALPMLRRNRARKIMVSHGFASHQWQRQRRFPWGLGQWLRLQPYVWRLPRNMREFDQIVFLSNRVDRRRFFDHWLLDRFGGPVWTAIPNGTWPQESSETGASFRELHGLGETFLILTVGLYAASKGQEAALRAFSDSRIGNATLVFIGNEFNDYARHLQKLAARLPLGERSAVLFLEQQARANIRAAYQAANLVLLASKGETQPLVLLDAMACGKPFLSTDVGCVSEMPGGLTARTAASLAGHLQTLRGDAARCQSLGKIGRDAAESTYYWPNIIETYDRLIRQLGSRSQYQL